MGRNAKLKEKHKWSDEQPKLHNARRLRGIYFIDLEDKEFKETIRNARKKLETPMAPAMPCKTSKTCKHGETRGRTIEITSKLACVMEASESTRLRMGEPLPNHHEDHIAGKVTIHCSITIWNTNLFLCLKPWKNGRNWKRFWRGTWRKHRKYNGRVVLRGDVVKDDSGSYAVFTEQGSSASQMTEAKVVDIISILPGCAGQAADAVSDYTQFQMEDAPKLLKIPKSECPDIWIRLPRHKRPKSWSSMEDPVVPPERNLYGHPFAGLLWKRQCEKILLKFGWEKVSNWMLIRTPWKGLFLSVCVDAIKLAGKNQNIDPMWKVLNKEVDLGEPTSFFDHVYLGCTQRQCEISKGIVDKYRTMLKSWISAGGTEKLRSSEILCISSWSYDMEGHARWCVERYCELANKTTQQLYKVSTPCIDDHHFEREELKSVGELLKVCSQIVLKCSYLARIGRSDILWSVNKLARPITKWTKACDKRLCRLISYIHHTCECGQCCRVGSTAKKCRLGLFQDFDFTGDLDDSKFTSVGAWCISGSYTFVPISWRCKKQTSVSHSSTESEIISLDAGLRLDGISALDLWDLIVAVLGNTNQSHKEWWDPFWNKPEVRSTPHTIYKRKQSQGMISDLDNVDFILQTSTLLIRKLCCMCLKTREEVRQWDMFPEPTELLLIGYSIESIWTPKSKSNTLTPKTNSQTYWPRVISHMMNGIIFCVWSTSAISVPSIVLKRCRKEHKKM